jgi:hypothetical protein
MRSKVLSQEIVRFKSDFEGHAKMTYFDIKYGQYAKSFEDIRWVLSLVERIFRELNDETISGLFDSENILLDRGEIGNAVNLNFYERRVYESFSFHDSFIEFIHQVWDLSDEANNYKIKEAIYHLMSQYMFSSFSRDKNLLTSFLRKFLFSFLYGKKNLEKTEFFSYYISDTIFHIVYSNDTELLFVENLNLELFNYFKFLLNTENVRPIEEFYQAMVERSVLAPRDIIAKQKSFNITTEDNKIIIIADRFILNNRFLGIPYLHVDYDALKRRFNEILAPGSDDLKKFYSEYYEELDYKFKSNSFVELIIIVLAYSMNRGNVGLVKSIIYFNQPKKNFSTYSNREKIPVRIPSWHYFVSKLDDINHKYSWMWKGHEEPDYDVYLLFVIFFIRLMDSEQWEPNNIRIILRYGKEFLNENEILTFRSNLKKISRVGIENRRFLEDNFGGEEMRLNLLLEEFQAYEI